MKTIEDNTPEQRTLYQFTSQCRRCEYADLTVDFGKQCPECGSNDVEEFGPDSVRKEESAAELKAATEYLLSQGLEPEAIKAEGMRRIAPLLQRHQEDAIRTRLSNLAPDSQERADGIVLLTTIDALRAAHPATAAPEGAGDAFGPERSEHEQQVRVVVAAALEHDASHVKLGAFNWPRYMRELLVLLNGAQAGRANATAVAEDAFQEAARLQQELAEVNQAYGEALAEWKAAAGNADRLLRERNELRQQLAAAQAAAEAGRAYREQVREALLELMTPEGEIHPEPAAFRAYSTRMAVNGSVRMQAHRLGIDLSAPAQTPPPATPAAAEPGEGASEPVKLIDVVCFDVKGHGVLILTPEQVAKAGGYAGVVKAYGWKDEHVERVVGEKMPEEEFRQLEDFRNL